MCIHVYMLKYVMENEILMYVDEVTHTRVRLGHTNT